MSFPPATGWSCGGRVLPQLRDPLVVVLLAAAVLTVATGDWADAAIIALVVIVNTRPRLRSNPVGRDRYLVTVRSFHRPG
jgi:hypothetical protein